MIRNHVKISLRNLSKHRLFTAIKLTGLTVGIAACLLIGLYLQHELAYDGFHEKADRIMRVTMEYRNAGETQVVGVTGNKVVPSFRRDFPEVESGVRINQFTQVVRYADRLFEEENFYYADSTFFDIFSFPLLAGNPKTALNAPKQVVLTARMAQKYFGDQDPLGKILKVGSTGEYLVSGVMADPPTNSHLQPDFIGSLVSGVEPRGQRLGVNLLFAALLVVVGG
ncbi:MAG TPA: ABC transporter permease, partial [Saprospiraceae bacterium]|nr:ABC transporter permease [Saprospiraceae bacterium]